MLQIDKSRHSIDSQPAQPSVVSAEELFKCYGAFVRRQFPVFLFVMLLSIVLATVYLFTTPPRYTGEAVLILDTNKLNFLQQQTPVGVDLPVDTALVDSQVEILRSENIALAVIKRLRLIDDPEFSDPKPGLLGAVLNLVWGLFESDGPPQSEFQLTRRAVGVFQNRLTIKRIGLTYAIQIDYQSLSPDRAAQIANAVADAYVDDSLQVKYQATKRAALWLQDRLGELRGQATAAERAAVDFKAKNNIVDVGGQLLDEQQLSQFNSDLVVAHSKTVEAEAKLNRVLEILNVEDRGTSDAPPTVTDSLADDVITKLRERYAEFAANEHIWSARYGSNHLAAVNLRNQMHEIRKSIDDELRRIAQTYKSDYEIAKSQEEEVQKRLKEVISQSNDTNRAEITLHDLDASAQNYRALADNFLQHYMESVQQQSFPISESHLITRATVSTRPSHPKIWLVLAVTGVGGMALSVGIGLLRDLSDRVYRTSSQIETDLQSDCIAVIPLINVTKKSLLDRGAASGAAAHGNHQGVRQYVVDSLSSHFTESIRSIKLGADLYGASKANKVIPDCVADLTLSKVTKKAPEDHGAADRAALGGDQGLWRHVVNSPFSRFTESIRSIKVAVDLYDVTKANNVVGMTSSLPNEGKSTIAAALAQLISQSGSRAILVDSDLRNPNLSRRLSPGATVGIVEVISGETALEDALWRDNATNLIFLPTVARTRLAHTSDLLGSAATMALFKRLREEFDYVIVDLSPLAPVVDVRSTGGLIDTYVFVIEWGRTKIDVVRHALRGARVVHDNLLGVVLNKTDIDGISRYENHGRDYYHNRYLSRYGYTD